MAEFELEDGAGTRRGSTPVLPPASGIPGLTLDERSQLQAYLHELDQYYAMIKNFEHEEPDVVLLACSGISARLTEIRAKLQRSGSARATQLRTREIDPLIEEIREQFKIHSRILSAREFDFKLSGGAP